MGLAVTAMAEEPGGTKLGTMTGIAYGVAPEREDAAVISRIKGVTDSGGYQMLGCLPDELDLELCRG